MTRLVLKRASASRPSGRVGVGMVRSHAAVGCPHAAAPATEAAAPEATEASTAAARRIAGTSDARLRADARGSNDDIRKELAGVASHGPGRHIFSRGE
jgi:hypothetical protein